MIYMFERKWNEEKKRHELILLEESEWVKINSGGRYGSGGSWVHMKEGSPDRIVDNSEMAFLEQEEATVSPMPSVAPAV